MNTTTGQRGIVTYLSKLLKVKIVSLFFLLYLKDLFL